MLIKVHFNNYYTIVLIIKDTWKRVLKRTQWTNKIQPTINNMSRLVILILISIFFYYYFTFHSVTIGTSITHTWGNCNLGKHLPTKGQRLWYFEVLFSFYNICFSIYVLMYVLHILILSIIPLENIIYKTIYFACVSSYGIIFSCPLLFRIFFCWILLNILTNLIVEQLNFFFHVCVV